MCFGSSRFEFGVIYYCVFGVFEGEWEDCGTYYCADALANPYNVVAAMVMVETQAYVIIGTIAQLYSCTFLGMIQLQGEVYEIM